jgi:hypothetical protein
MIGQPRQDEMRVFLGVAMGLLLAGTAMADGPRTVLLPGGPGEGVGIVIPAGWTLSHRDESGKTALLEWVPDGESAADWTAMISIQRFAGLPGVDPEAFLRQLQNAFAATCPAIVTGELYADTFEGLPIALHSLGCTANPQTGKGEVSLFTAIAGNQALYLFQRTWRTAPFTQAALPLTVAEIDAGSVDIGRLFVCADTAPAGSCPDSLRQIVAMADASLSPAIH